MPRGYFSTKWAGRNPRSRHNATNAFPLTAAAVLTVHTVTEPKVRGAELASARSSGLALGDTSFRRKATKWPLARPRVLSSRRTSRRGWHPSVDWAIPCWKGDLTGWLPVLTHPGAHAERLPSSDHRERRLSSRGRHRAARGERLSSAVRQRWSGRLSHPPEGRIGALAGSDSSRSVDAPHGWVAIQDGGKAGASLRQDSDRRPHGRSPQRRRPLDWRRRLRGQTSGCGGAAQYRRLFLQQAARGRPRVARRHFHLYIAVESWPDLLDRWVKSPWQSR